MLQTNVEFVPSWMESIFDSVYDGVVIVNAEGRIEYLSQNYCSFLDVELEKVLGKHVTSVIENTRMHIVAQSRQKETADLQFLRGNYVIASRIPILRNHKVVGAIGTIIFRDIKDWKEMNSQIKSTLAEMNFFVEDSKNVTGAKYSLVDFFGQSESINQIREKVKKIALGDISVLVHGESGTGKEIIAHSIHQLSERSHKPFMKVNCGCIPEHLLESELFGYEDGSFTGAKKGGKMGKFELANGGTIFLDEVGDMPLSMQIKLLRVLQEREIEPIGGGYCRSVDVRIIAATNKSLQHLVDENQFRTDLFYRLNGIELHIPPLRERRGDIKPLCEHFLTKVSHRINKRMVSIDSDVMNLFEAHLWPGNLRELENAIQAAAYLSSNHSITMDSLPDYLKGTKRVQKGLKHALAETEVRLIRNALQKSRGNKLTAAKLLDISKTTLYEKIKKFNLG